MSLRSEERAGAPGKNGLALPIDERRSMLARAGETIRALAGDAVRSLSKEAQDCVSLIQRCRATCYAGMYYLCYMPYDSFPDNVYSSLYECFQCSDLCVTLIGRESALSSAAHELCASACRESASVCTGSDDPILQACVAVCGQTADACDSMAAAGESEEDRAARKAGDEVRSCKFEVRSSDDGHIKGYPIIFNTLSQDLGGFRERILPTAVQFDEDLKADFNHNPDFILGRSAAGTLKVSADSKGVYMDAEPPDTTWARDLKVSINRGDIDQGSFSFRILPGGQQISEENGQQIRTLSKILVRRVSVVSDPAYTGTSVQVRSNSSNQDGTAGQAAPPASISGGGICNLRRRLDLAGL